MIPAKLREWCLTQPTNPDLVGSHQVYTPFELVDDVILELATYPKFDFSTSKILVLYNLEFVISLVYTYGVNKENIVFFSDNNYKSAIATAIGCNVITSLEKEMKFDVVVGNPPYQLPNNEAKRWTAWSRILSNCLDIADYVAFVIPQSVTSPTNYGMIKDNLIALNTTVKKHFNEGSTFCYIITSRNSCGSAEVVTEGSTYNIDPSEYEFLPFDITTDTLETAKKLSTSNNRVWKRGELHTSKKQLFSSTGKYSVMHTNAQTLMSDFEHSNRTKIRVAVSLSGYPVFKVVKDGYVSQACFWTEFNTIEEANVFADKCNGDKVQKLLQTFKWSGWNDSSVISRL